MIAINLALLGVFSWNLFRLYHLHQRIREIVSQPILSEDPSEFLAKLQASDAQWWIWAIMITATAISVALIAGLIIPSLNRYHYRAAIATSIWLGLWILYVIGVVVVGLMAINRIFA